MILNVETCWLGIDSSVEKYLLQVSLELFHAVLTVDVGSEELYVQQVADELSRLFTANTSTSSQKKAATWH